MYLLSKSMPYKMSNQSFLKLIFIIGKKYLNKDS